MKTQIKIAIATLTASTLSFLATMAHAGTINFSGYTWTTLDGTGNESSGINLNNTYAALNANSGQIGGRYGTDSGMATDVSLGVGYTVSYDYYLSNNDPGYTPGANGGNYYGDWTSEFWDSTSASSITGSGNWATGRTISASNSGDAHTWVSLENGNNYFNVTSGLDTGVHFVYTFDATTYTITGTSIANPVDTWSVTRTYWNGGVSDIQSFRVGLWDSEQTATLANFTVTPVPEPGTISLLALGGLGILTARRRRL